MEEFVLIIPTHERHEYLNRSMKYYASLEHKVIYCDSSNKEYKGIIPININYIHCPDKKFGEKVLFVLNSIKTKFVALCPDDDFTSKNTLNHSLEFLQKNSLYKSVLGKTIGFDKKFNGKFYNITRKKLIDVEDSSPKERVETFFKNYHNTLWGLYEVSILKNAFEIIENSKFSNDNFIEMVIATVSSFSGKVKELNDIWSVREISEEEHWGKRHKSLSNCYKEPEIVKDISVFSLNIDNITSKGIGETAINSYFKGIKEKEPTTMKRLKNNIFNFLPIELKKYIPKTKNKVYIQMIENSDLSEIAKLIN